MRTIMRIFADGPYEFLKASTPTNYYLIPLRMLSKGDQFMIAYEGDKRSGPFLVRGIGAEGGQRYVDYFPIAPGQEPTMVQRTRKFDLMSLPYETCTGRIAFHSYVQPHDAVVVALSDLAGRLVLLHQHRHPLGSHIWEFPAGTIDEGESPEETAVREVREETGFAIEDIYKVGEFFTAPGYSTEKIHVFRAVGYLDGDTAHSPHERISVHYFPVATALSMVRDGQIMDAKTLIAMGALATDAMSSLDLFLKTISG